jgi:UDP-glucose 4-epimerase
MKDKILVTGGCGYIGSHTIVDLLDHGYEVVSADNLSNADEQVLEGIEKISGKRVKNFQVDLADRTACNTMFREVGSVKGIIHFAAYKSVGESVEQPLKYYHNNINSQLNLMELGKEHGVEWFVFSSSCSVYGNPEELPVSESTPLQKAESPYAFTKQIGEQMIYDYAKVNQSIKFVLLRYFNPAGAHESALIGESSRNVANNLVPVITETAIGKRESMTVFGDDYPTRDGSCIRDYIHVMDLANAHTLALEYMINGRMADTVDLFNLGIGEGVSVLEAARAFEQVSGQSFNYSIGPRRPGDVVAVYASVNKASKVLGWSPKRNIGDIMRTAWEWEKARTQG